MLDRCSTHLMLMDLKINIDASCILPYGRVYWLFYSTTRYGDCLHQFWLLCFTVCFWHWTIYTQNARLYIPVCAPIPPSASVVYLGMLSDIKADNIMFGIADDSVFSDFEENELQDPSPRKELDGRTIYISRELRMPKQLGSPVLCDFGSAVLGDEKHSEDIQPDIYRAPEVILEAPWTYSVDIWNVGCMVRQPVQ